MYNKIREIQRAACFVLRDCQWALGQGREAGADGSVQLSPHFPPNLSALCRLEHGNFVRISRSEPSSAVRAAVLGVACKSSFGELEKSCKLHSLHSLRRPWVPTESCCTLERFMEEPVLVGANEARSCLSCC